MVTGKSSLVFIVLFTHYFLFGIAGGAAEGSQGPTEGVGVGYGADYREHTQQRCLDDEKL